MILRIVIALGSIALGSIAGPWAGSAWSQEREMPPAPAPVGILRTPGQAPRVEAPAAEAAAVEHPARRGTARAFGEPVVVEVRSLPTPAADAALREAVTELLAIEALADGSAAGGLGALNAAAGAGARPVDPRLGELLARALSFCTWSRGAHGPLGGRLYQAWGFDGGGRGLPPPEEVRQAAGAASCDGLAVDAAAGTASLAPGRRLDLRGFARGYAVDRAVEVLSRSAACGGRPAAVRPGAAGRSCCRCSRAWSGRSTASTCATAPSPSPRPSIGRCSSAATGWRRGSTSAAGARPRGSSPPSSPASRLSTPRRWRWR
jgi:hypothetical protein